MTGRKRTALLATVVSLVGVAAAVPMMVSGTASAQEGSRLCGRIFHTTPGSVDDKGVTLPQETVILLYEVQKNDRGRACSKANQTDGSFNGLRPFESPFDLIQKNKRFWNGDGDAIDMETCETFTTATPPRGGRLGNRGLEFLKKTPTDNTKTPIDNWPATKDQADICNNMNRSDTIFEMERYWLHDKNGVDKWEFIRG